MQKFYEIKYDLILFIDYRVDFDGCNVCCVKVATILTSYNFQAVFKGIFPVFLKVA